MVLPDPLSSLFEFGGVSESRRESATNDCISKSPVQLSPSLTKSIRLRSEKGRRALSENNPKRAQEDLQTVVATQKSALFHHAKKVNELNKAVNESNERIEHYKEEVKELKSKLGSKIRTVDELNNHLLAKDRDNTQLVKEKDLAKENSNRLLQELEDCKSKLQELQGNERNIQRAREAQEEENRDFVTQLQQLRVELSAQQNEKHSQDAVKEQGNLSMPAESHSLPITSLDDNSGNIQQQNEKYDILDPTLDITGPSMENTFRERVPRKAEFYCFNATNPKAIHLQRERIPSSIQGLIGEFTLRKERVQVSSDDQSSSESPDTVNQFSVRRSNVIGPKSNLKVQDTFEKFMGLSEDMVPMMVNSKLVFRKATLVSDVVSKGVLEVSPSSASLTCNYRSRMGVELGWRGTYNRTELVAIFPESYDNADD